MTNCKICYKSKSEHSKRSWLLHIRSQVCQLCYKNSSEHSEKLWEIHNKTVEMGLYCPLHKKREKLYPINIGFARKTAARACYTIVQNKPFGTTLLLPSPPNDVDYVPIYISCKECGLYLGSDEEDCADILDTLCFVCFKKITDQSEVD